VGKTNYKPQKVMVYNQLAVASASDGKLQDALHYYDLKHRLDSGSARKDSRVMGQLYERLGDKQKAIEQYTIQLSYEKGLPNAAQLQTDIATLQGQINALKGEVQ
jgi:tetratricopeptide (TPR) repeat protein